jgi:HPt (histidine-containing phosphotransfer) domain-containing protein
MHAEQSIIDMGAINELRLMLGKRADKKLPALIASFYPNATLLIGQARDALGRGAVDGVRLAAHTLKSNDATFGATRLSMAALDLERAARDHHMDEAHTTRARIEREYERARAALEELFPT